MCFVLFERQDNSSFEVKNICTCVSWVMVTLTRVLELLTIYLAGFETLTKRLDRIKVLLKFDMGKVGVLLSEILWVILLHLKQSFGLFLISLNGNIN
jgi:hypothetical protein